MTRGALAKLPFDCLQSIHGGNTPVAVRWSMGPLLLTEQFAGSTGHEKCQPLLCHAVCRSRVAKRGCLRQSHIGCKPLARLKSWCHRLSRAYNARNDQSDLIAIRVGPASEFLLITRRQTTAIMHYRKGSILCRAHIDTVLSREERLAEPLEAVEAPDRREGYLGNARRME